MSDLLKNFSKFKLLGFDNSTQWILYEESFQKFVLWFANNITEDNILSEIEVLQEMDLKQQLQYIRGESLEKSLAKLNENHCSILEYTDDDIAQLEYDVQRLKNAAEMYGNLVKNMEDTKSTIIEEITELKTIESNLEVDRDSYSKKCENDSKQLETLQKQNKMLSDEINNCLTGLHSPPLFVHQLNLDQYFQKCDAFLQYLTLHMEENFNIRSYLPQDEQEDIHQVVDNLQSLQKALFLCHVDYKEASAHVFGLQQMIAGFNGMPSSLSQMKKETREFESHNKHNMLAVETLQSDLKQHLEKLSEHFIEKILYENSKQKLDRANRRLDGVNFLLNIISSGLANSELVWILMQLDLERVQNRVNYTEQLNVEIEKATKRIEDLQQLQMAPSTPMSELLAQKISEILSKGSSSRKSISVRSCVNDYEKFCRLSTYTLKQIINKKCYTQVLRAMEMLTQTEAILNSYMFYGPFNGPTILSNEFFQWMCQCRINQEKNQKNLTEIRSAYGENIVKRMNTDKLWRYSQLLWMWFLAEPQKLARSLEEVRKAASDIPAFKIKISSGIKRQ